MIISDGRKIKVYNYSQETLYPGRIVIIRGKRVSLASTDTNSIEYPLGLTIETIYPATYGEVLLEGTASNINTSIYPTGNPLLYLQQDGGINTSPPSTAKDEIFVIGHVINNDVEGSIYFRPVTPALSGSGGVWGSITGDIADQGDLGDLIDDINLAIDAKFDQPAGTTSEYVRGDGSIATFPTTGGGILNGVATASTENVYTASITGATAYTDGDAYLIRFTTGNTSTATLNINSLGAKTLYRNNDGQLIGGDIISGAEMLCVYSSTLNGFQVIGTAPNTLLAYVTNAETTTITKGQPVYAFGAQGDRLTVKLAYNTGDATSAQTVGIVVADIAANQKGLIMLNGQLDGLGLFKPSDGWQDGDAVYLGPTAGTVTRVKPHAPNHLVYLGFVVTANSGSAGRMYVRVQNGYEMDELHDVAAQNPNNNDTLRYNSSTNLWEAGPVIVPAGMTWMGAFPG